MKHTIHSQKRVQQRCLPPVVQRWLSEYGDEEYDGRGAIRRYFSRRSLKNMEKDLGHHFVRENMKYLRAYMVESSEDGVIITAGWLTQKMKRA